MASISSPAESPPVMNEMTASTTAIALPGQRDGQVPGAFHQLPRHASGDRRVTVKPPPGHLEQELRPLPQARQPGPRTMPEGLAPQARQHRRDLLKRPPVRLIRQPGAGHHPLQQQDAMTEIDIMQPHHVLASSPRVQRRRLVSSDLQVRGHQTISRTRLTRELILPGLRAAGR